MTGITEMFAELDGRARYDEALERWSAQLHEYHRNYHREYRRNRYRTDAVYRANWRAYMTQWRANRRRALGKEPRKRAEHGSYSKYSDGCRCASCRAASTQYQRDRRARLKAAA